MPDQTRGHLTSDELRSLVDEPCDGCFEIAGPQMAEELLALRVLVADLTDRERCDFDHHGGCQAHGYLSLEPGQMCPQAEAQRFLAEWAQNDTTEGTE